MKITVITVVSVVVSYILFNYFVDSLSVFHQRTDPFESYSDVNERFMKSLYLEEYCTENSTIIMGDSRTAGYVTADVEKRFPNSNAYNYGVQSDTLVGIYQKLKWLAENVCLPQRIIIPLSIDRIELYDFADDTRLLMQENPAVLKRKGVDFEYYWRQWAVFKKYLFSSSIFINNIKYIQNHISDRKYHLRFVPSTGDTYYYFDHPCKKNHPAFGKIKLNSDQVDNFVNQLKAVYDYANSRGIEVILVWNPQMYAVQMSYELESVVSLIKKIVPIAPSLYRVSLDDESLKDINSYHDCSHFKKKLGARVFDEQNYISSLELIEEFQHEHSSLLSQRIESVE